MTKRTHGEPTERLLRKLELEQGERVEAAWVAGIPFKKGRFAKYGGDLVLTDRRLLFEPLDVAGMSELGDAIGDVFGTAEDFRTGLALSAVTRAETGSGKSAQLVLLLESGESVMFLVSAGRMTPMWSKKNRVALDHAIKTINSALGAGSSAIVPPGG